MALLVLLVFFHLILDIHSQNVPQLRVSPEVITESGSVELHCDVPHNVKVSQCYFYTERDKTRLKLSPSCQLSVTGSELIRWTGPRSPGTLRIICYYTVDKSGIHVPSPHSLPAPVTVMYQKPKLSVDRDDRFDEFILSCEIPVSESVTADFSCNLYTGENPQLFLNRTSRKVKSGKVACIFKAQRNDLFNRLQSVKSRVVSCDYSLTSDPTAGSLMSDKYSMIRFFPTPTQPSITTEKSTAYQKPILSVSHDHQLDEFILSCEIPVSESVTADFSCNLYTGENPQLYVKTFFQKRESGKVVCIFKAQRNDVFNRLQSVKSRVVSCDYSLTSDPTARSLMSDKYSMIHFFPEPTQPPTTKKSTTASPVLSTHLITTRHTTTTENARVTQNHHLHHLHPHHSSTSDPNNLFPLPTMSSTTKEKSTSAESARVTQHHHLHHLHPHHSSTSDPNNLFPLPTMSSTTKEKSTSAFPDPFSNVNTTRGPKTRSLFILPLSVISVCILLAGMMSVCLCWFIRKQAAERRKMDMTRDDQGVMISMLNMNTSGSEDARTYSVISSVPLPSLPSDTSGDIKEDSKKTEDDVYHMYCTIADTHVVTKDKDTVYSLLQTH